MVSCKDISLIHVNMFRGMFFTRLKPVRLVSANVPFTILFSIAFYTTEASKRCLHIKYGGMQ